MTDICHIYLLQLIQVIKMHIQRLFEIVYLLLYRKKITARELAERFEVSTRTIYRDLDTLSAAGIPLYTTKGRDGGIFLMDGFVLNRSLLSEEEQKEILSSLQGVTTLSQQSNDETLNRMRMMFRQDIPDWIAVDLSDWSNTKKQIFEDIRNAIWNHHILTFTYCSTNGEETSRSVCPLQLWFKDHCWYLKAYCQERNAHRVFKITRMRNVAMQKTTFSILSLPKEENQALEIPIEVSTVELQLQIASSMAYRVYDEFEDEEITKLDNGDFYIRKTYSLDAWVYGNILSYGATCKVLSPQFVVDNIKQQIKEMYQLNEGKDVNEN